MVKNGKSAWPLLCLGWVACTADSGLLNGGEAPDRGTEVTDGGVQGTDAGLGVDAGNVDAGMNADAGAAVDVGAARDAGSPEEIEQALARAECRYAATCYRRFYFDAFGADPGCVESGGYGLGRTARARIEAGRAVVDPEQLAACLAALEAADCADTARAQACERALVGTLAQGDSCLNSAECSPGLRCHGITCGTCQPALPTGATCDANVAGCEGYCYTQFAGTPGTCLASNLLEGELCSGVFSDCEAPLRCVRVNDDERRCQPCPQPGEVCGEPGSGLLGCDPAQASCEAGVCQALIFVDPGQACEQDRICRGICVQGQCRPAPQLGEACPPLSGACAGALGLCGSDGVCRPRPKEGEACQGYDSCERGLTCDVDPPRCTSRPWETCN